MLALSLAAHDPKRWLGRSARDIRVLTRRRHGFGAYVPPTFRYRIQGPGGDCCARLIRSASSEGRRALSLRTMSSPLGRKTISLIASTASEANNKTTMPTNKVRVPRFELGAIG